MKEYIELAQAHNQRVGQFINNAICEYLTANNRVTTDEEVAQCLFYLDDQTLYNAVRHYDRLLTARKPVGFTVTEKKK
jgi:hypothetical protein